MNQTNKIGILDSGLGGLIILRSIRSLLPQYDYVYYGDTANMPYGAKTQADIRRLTIASLEQLFALNCSLVIIACNTISAKALRHVQQQWLPKHYPGKKVLGIIVPTIEAVTTDRSIKTAGLIATASTAASHAYRTEIAKVNSEVKTIELATPLLATCIERGWTRKSESILSESMHQLTAKRIDSLILGCTHYVILKEHARKLAPNLLIISQDEIIPRSLRSYLKRHPEIRSNLSKNGTVELHASKLTSHNSKLTKEWFPDSRLHLLRAK